MAEAPIEYLSIAELGARLRSGALSPVQLTEHLAERAAVWPRRHHPVLRALEARRRHHLHGLGDLAGLLNRADAAAELAGLRHQLPIALKSSIAFRTSAASASSSAASNVPAIRCASRVPPWRDQACSVN